MKKLILMFLALSILASCNNDDDSNTEDSELVGDWKLIEVLMDPGDGSGTFYSVDSDKTITFLTDGTFTSNGNICSMADSVENPSSGIYSELDAIITPDVCEGTIPNWNYTFVIEGNTLIIHYPCIEPCEIKYQKQ